MNLEGRNPIGQAVVSFGPGLKPQQMQVVGLAKNARYDELTGNFPAVVYVPFGQNLAVPVEDMTFFLRTAGDPLVHANTVRQIVHDADPRVPVTDLGAQTAQIDDQMSQQILFARLCTAFALLALAIACVGLYGTVSYTVARRTSEIGIRIALGARRGTVVWMVMRDVLVLAAIALAISLPAAMGASKFVESFLYGIKGNDPVTIGAAVAVLVAAAISASYLPARNASRIEPMNALRHE